MVRRNKKIRNVKDAQKLAKKVLQKNYGDHTVHSVIHAEGTNVWEIFASTEELEIRLTLNEETGEMMAEPSVQRIVKRHIVEELIPITDRISTKVTHEWEKISWKWLFVTIGLTITGSVISAYFNQIIGIIISLIFGGLSIWYGKYAFTHFKETRETL